VTVMHPILRALCAVATMAVAWDAARPLAAQQPAVPPVSTQKPAPGLGGLSMQNGDPFPSTYVPRTAPPYLVRNVRIMTAAGPTIANGSLLVRDGRIAAIGASVRIPPIVISPSMPPSSTAVARC